MRKITIAIDGYSSTGKSTLAKQLAAYFNYVYVDSGAMYRAITLFALEQNLIGDGFFEKERLIARLPEIHLRFQQETSSDTAVMVLNNRNVEKEIRTLHVSQFVSMIAEVPQIRKKLVQLQQQMGREKGVVMDGRDIGTVVFPDAELKIFMTASAEERARRRYEELLQKGEHVRYEDVLQNVQERDHIDSTRHDSPLTKTDDAIELDNTFTTIEDQFHTVLQLAKDRIAGRI